MPIGLSGRRGWRRPWITLVVSVWGLAGVAPATGFDHEQGPPVAVVDQATYDFGEVYEGEHISHTFTIRNTGSAPLEIRDPAAKAQNAVGDRTMVTAAMRVGAGDQLIPAGDRAAEFPIIHASEAGAGLGRALLVTGGKRAAPS